MFSDFLHFTRPLSLALFSFKSCSFLSHVRYQNMHLSSSVCFSPRLSFVSTATQKLRFVLICTRKQNNDISVLDLHCARMESINPFPVSVTSLGQSSFNYDLLPHTHTLSAEQILLARATQ